MDKLTREVNGGVQHIHRFDNGYGASVVCHEYSYGGDRGLWEIAVLRFNGDSMLDWYITYDTPITNDVIGHLASNDVENILEQIKALEPA